MSTTSDGHRRSIRLHNYDYASSGAYFVTVCSYQKQLLFVDTELKSIIEAEWQALEQRFPTIGLDAFVVMPNHIHFILWLGVGASLAGAQRGRSTPNRIVLQGEARSAQKLEAGLPAVNQDGPASVSPTAQAGASPAPTLASVVGAFKSIVAVRWLRWIKANSPDTLGKVWQRNYYERVIRDEAELNRIREYIIRNPERWKLDRENDHRISDAEYEREWDWLEA